jgi:hypothetical protein
MARKISGPKLETIRPSMMIVLSRKLGMSPFLAAPRPFRIVHRRLAYKIDAFYHLVVRIGEVLPEIPQLDHRAESRIDPPGVAPGPMPGCQD